MVNKRNKKGLINSTFSRYSGIIIAATLASTISSFVDGCITGSLLGSLAMAAFGIAMPFVLILVVVMGMILSSGGSICGSKAIGAGNKEKANSNFTACLLMGLIIGIIALLVCFVFPDPLIKISGAEGDLAKEASAYLKGYGFGAIPTIVLTIFMYYSNLDGNENLSFLAVVVMTVVDIVLDLVLGVKMSMGLFGMALATSISYICAIVIFLVFFLSGKSSFSLCFKHLLPESWDIIRTGYPSALNTLLVSCRCFFLNSILMKLAGSEAVSAFSFQSNFNQFFIAIATGISTAVSVLTGIYIGEKDKKSVCSSVKCGIRYGVLFSAVFMVVLFLAAPLMTQLLLSGSAESSEYAIMALRLYSLSMPVSIINITLISFYQTTEDRKTANTIAIGHGLVLPLGAAYLLSLVMGLNGVWISTLIAECLMIVILAVILKFRTGKFPKGLEGLAVIDTKEFPDERSVFVYAAATGNLEQEAVCDQLRKFMTGAGCGEDIQKQMLQVFSSIVNEGKILAKYVDIQCYPDDKAVALNIRFDGGKMDKLLNSAEWQKNNGIVVSTLEVSSHYSAGISFVNIRKKTPEQK